MQITTVYPGAFADAVARTVATPLEQQINGIENMLYMGSQSTGDGKLTITVTFRIGTDLNVAQMLTQNRLEDALPRLPEDVQRLGVQVGRRPKPRRSTRCCNKGGTRRNDSGLASAKGVAYNTQHYLLAWSCPHATSQCETRSQALLASRM